MDARIEYYRQQLEEINRLCEDDQVSDAYALCEALQQEAGDVGDQGFALFFAGESAALYGDLRKGARLQVQAVKELSRIEFVLGNCAVLLSMAGKPHHALELLDMVLELASDNQQALGQKGVCLSKMGYDEQALVCFDRLLELDPGQHHAMRNRAVSLSRLGREREALEIFEQVLRENPSDKHARSERAVLLDEIHLRGTPLGWLLIWFRKRLAPALLRLRYRIAEREVQAVTPN